jgi:hypothetical protein
MVASWVVGKNRPWSLQGKSPHRLSSLSELGTDPEWVGHSLLDLCSFIVCHRFFSAGWFQHLSKHVSTTLDVEAFERVVMLDVSWMPPTYASDRQLIDDDERPVLAG